MTDIGKIAKAQNMERARALFLEGLRAYQASRYTEAAESFEAALDAAPGRASIIINLASTHLKLGLPQQALQLLDAMLSVEPDQADAHALRGSALAALGDDKTAVAAFANALRLAPANGAARAQRALSLLPLGRFAEALTDLEALPPPMLQSAETWWHRGRALQGMDRLVEAEAALRHATTLDPALGGAWGHLGALLKDGGRRDEAVACLRKAQALTPEDPVPVFLLASLQGHSAPPAPPTAFVRALFDGYAAGFDRHLTHDLHYRAPEVLMSLLRPYLPADATSTTRALDLGCGTGLMGTQLHQSVALIDGVDLSPLMLQQARARGVYRELHEADVVGFLRGLQPASSTAGQAWQPGELSPLHQPPAAPRTQSHLQSALRGCHNLVTATDLFIYIGDLAPLFAALAAALPPASLFAFSVERDDQAASFALRPTTRYAHSRPALMSWAQQHGFAWCAERDAPLRDEQGQAVQGLYVVLQRRG